MFRSLNRSVFIVANCSLGNLLHLSTRKQQMNSCNSLCNSDPSPSEARGKIYIKTAYWDFILRVFVSLRRVLISPCYCRASHLNSAVCKELGFFFLETESFLKFFQVFLKLETILKRALLDSNGHLLRVHGKIPNCISSKSILSINFEITNHTDHKKRP